MGIRRTVIEYSRGNNLRFFWFLYRLRKRVGNRLLYDSLTFMMSRSAHHHGGYIGPDTLMKNTPSLPHGLHGVFISRYARIGENCRIYQNVTIGEVNRQAPVIGDNCLIGAGAVIIGNIKIGNNVKIGAGAVVEKDVPDDCTVVSRSARLIERKKEVEDHDERITKRGTRVD